MESAVAKNHAFTLSVNCGDNCTDLSSQEVLVLNQI